MILNEFNFRLALCVKRHDDILSFVPKPFWTVQATIQINNEPIKVTSSRGRMFEKRKATDVRESLKTCKTGTVINVESERKTTQRPHALNTVELLKAASSGLGIAPHQAVSR
jgi:DNA topoisomerase-3